jgi:HD-like signal output (HDOD) protein
MATQHLLFVETNGDVLQGVLQELSAEWPDWHIVRVTEPEAALRVMSQYRVGVVLAGCSMERDACERLFRLVKEKDPAVVRVALTDESQLGSERIMENAHQCLRSPCSTGFVQKLLKSSLGVWAIGRENPRLSAFTSDLKSLPTPPALYFDIKEVLESPSGSLTGVARLVARDPALAAKILKTANSGLYAMPRTITELDTAITLLGTEIVLGLVINLHIYSQLPLPGLDLDKTWLHSIAVSSLAKRVAFDESGDQRQANVAGVAGLLHDIGQLVLMTQASADYFAAIRSSDGNETKLFSIEREKFGVDHAELGGYLLALWGLPDILVEAVRHHHVQLSETPGTLSPVLRAVLVAERLLEEYGARVDRLDACANLEQLLSIRCSQATDWWLYIDQLVEQGLFNNASLPRTDRHS